MVKIINKKSGNCGCYNCGRLQDGWKMHPWTVYHKADGESRGHNDPVCCLECAKEYSKKFE